MVCIDIHSAFSLTASHGYALNHPLYDEYGGTWTRWGRTLASHRARLHRAIGRIIAPSTSLEDSGHTQKYTMRGNMKTSHAIQCDKIHGYELVVKRDVKRHAGSVEDGLPWTILEREISVMFPPHILGGQPTSEPVAAAHTGLGRPGRCG